MERERENVGARRDAYDYAIEHLFLFERVSQPNSHPNTKCICHRLDLMLQCAITTVPFVLGITKLGFGPFFILNKTLKTPIQRFLKTIVREFHLQRNINQLTRTLPMMYPAQFAHFDNIDILVAVIMEVFHNR